MTDRVKINRLPTGVPGLDDVLGGGLPEFSFNIIAGGPGAGKTTLAQQLVFATATPERTALFITIVGEPPLKMLRYQQQFTFFDASKIPGSVRFLHLGDVLVERGLAGVLEAIVQEVELRRPGLVVVDSFRSAIRKGTEPGQLDVDQFVQRLSLHLTSWEATTFLIGEYTQPDDSNSLFSVADGIVWLYQQASRNAVVRKLQVIKMRGQAHRHGLHALAIRDDGLRVFPRTGASPRPNLQLEPTLGRRSMGIPALDAMLGGGIPAGSSMLIAGPTGSGKTTISSQFLLAGCERSEPGVLAVFDPTPLRRLKSSVPTRLLGQQVDGGRLKIVSLGPLDLSVDEALLDISEAVAQIGARRLVIDSLSSFELALASAYREDFREALHRVIGTLTQLGVTVVMTAETTTSDTGHPQDPYGISFLTDGIIATHYVEIEAQLRRAIMVLKLRDSAHSKDICDYEIDESGISIGEPLRKYEQLMSGMPRLRHNQA